MLELLERTDLTSVLCGSGEERSALDLFPEVKTSVVPVLSDVVDIVADNGPNVILNGGLVSVVDEPVGVGDHSNGSQRRTVALGAS